MFISNIYNSSFMYYLKCNFCESFYFCADDYIRLWILIY